MQNCTNQNNQYITRMTRIKKLLLVIMGCFMLQTLQAQTVDEVIAKYVDALGGEKKVKALKSIKIIGILRKEGFALQITTTVLHTVGTRTDIVVPDVGAGYQIVTPTKGWSFTPFNGQTKPQELTAAQVASGQIGIDLQGALYNYKQKGHQAELMGKEMVDSIECYKIKLTYKTGKEIYYYIDTQHYYRIKLMSIEMVNDKPTEVATIYSDFRRTPEGYLLPYTQSNVNGTMTVSLVSINKPIDKALFTVKQ